MSVCECGCGQPTTIARKNETRWGHVKGQPIRFLPGHNLRQLKVDPVERFWDGFTEDPHTHCWMWRHSLVQCGYGRCGYTQAHRFAYELLVGPIPEGLQIDHLCRNRACVNPGHMEPVTIAENVLRGEGLTARAARQTHCKRGHPLSGPNVRVNAKGHRICRACAAWHQRRYNAQAKAAA